MNKLAIKSKKEILTISSNRDSVVDLIRDSQYLRHIIPVLEVIEKTKKEKTYLLNLLNGDTFYRSSYKTITFSGNLDLIGEGQLCFLIFHTLQNIALRNNRYFIHGAAVSHKNESTLIVGPSRSGKSTIALDLALNIADTQLYGDDSISLKILKNNLILDSGNTHVSINPIHRKNPKVKFIYEPNNQFYLDSRDLNIHTEESLKLSNVIFLEPDIFRNEDKKEIESTRGKMLLYEHISRECRAAGYCIISHNLPLPSHDDFKRGSTLLEAINSSSIRYFRVSGNYKRMKDLCGSIVRDKW